MRCEGLVLFAVQVERRLGSLRFEDLDDREEVSRLFARGLDGGQATTPPPCVSLAFLEPETSENLLLSTSVNRFPGRVHSRDAQDAASGL
jgi:hypothetical protein